MNAHPTPLRFLVPGWFAVIMGLTGLALAWGAWGLGFFSLLAPEPVAAIQPAAA